jgi:hypothetical protein
MDVLMIGLALANSGVAAFVIQKTTLRLILRAMVRAQAQ